MKENIQQKILEMIGEDDVYTDNLPPEEEYPIEAYNQAKKGMRIKAPDLAQKIVEIIKNEINFKGKEGEEIIDGQIYKVRFT